MTVAWLTRQTFDSERFNGFLLDRADSFATTSILLFEFAGVEALRIWRDDKEDRRNVRVYLVDTSMQDVVGEILPDRVQTHFQRIDDLEEPFISIQQRIRVVSYPIETTQGDLYQVMFVVPEQFGLPSLPSTISDGILMRITVILLIIGVICFAIAYFLAKPLRRLTLATQRLASGDLSVRVLPDMGGRKDEIGVLAREFDEMAEKLQQIMDTQQRLLRDISHELRSPLARMQVALELARKQAPERIHISVSRIQRESDRLNELIGEILSLVKLDAGAVNRSQDQVRLDELIQRIVDDARFEQDELKKRIQFQYDQPHTLLGNAELLYRAIENIIRNALHYSNDDTTVEVYLSTHKTQNNCVHISVLDRGPGIAEEQIKHLFEPFFRAQAARDRDSGGYGLGLAIAERSIHFHGGSIYAYNRKNGGLAIDIVLPISERLEDYQ